MSVKLRIIQGVGANSFGQGVTLLIQLASVPILINAWGIDLYGEWIAISAIPTYLVLSEVGLTSTSGNALALIADTGSKRGLQTIYQSTWFMVSLLSLLVISLFAIAILTINLKPLLGLKIVTNTDLKITLLLLLTHVALSLQTGLIQIVFRYLKKNPIAIFISNLTRLFEWVVATVWVVSFHGQIIQVAASFLSIRMIGNIILWLSLHRYKSPLQLGFAFVSKSEIKKLLKPSLASMCFPLGLSLTLQGFVILISSLVGSGAVALFSLYRTFTRIPIQMATAINQAIWPEISYSFGNGKMQQAGKLVIKMQLYCFILGSVSSLAIYLSGEKVIDFWVSKPLDHNQFLLIMLTATAFIHILWQPFWVAQMAINKHLQFAKHFLLISVLSLLSGIFLTTKFALDGAAISILAGECLLAFTAFVNYSAQFNAKKQGYIGYLINNRTVYPLFSYFWFKTWAKRLFNTIGLLKILLRIFKLAAKGAEIGYMSVIGRVTTNGKVKNLRLGNESAIGSDVHLALHDTIELGHHVVINDGCKLLTASHDIDCLAWKQISAPIRIKDYAWIASNVIILPGVTIGTGAVVGAGSVVTRDVPDFHVVAGNPAKFIKERQLKNPTHSPVRWLAPFEAWLGLPSESGKNS